jgi:hypothetical protein
MSSGNVCTASYLRKDGSCLLGVYSFSYMRQVGAVCKEAILGRLADVCGVFLNSVSYFRKVGGCLHGMCNLLVI